MLGMSTKVSVLTVCAAVLLATLAGPVTAGCVKNPFGGESAYVALANHLHQATESNKLEDNIEQVSLLEIQQPNAGKKIQELAQIFGSLKHNAEDPASMCSKDNLSNLRQLTEAMSADGNMGPKKITEPISRLNGILIKFIIEARSICGRHLAAKWPIKEDSANSDPKLAQSLKKTTNGFSDDTIKHIQSMGLELSMILDTHVLSDSDMPLGSATREENFNTIKGKLLARQVEKYLYEPCKEFLSLDVAKSVLEPYNELHKSYKLIDGEGAMKEFYKKELQQPNYNWIRDFQPFVDQAAERYRICTRLLTVPASQVALSVGRARLSAAGQSFVDKTKAKLYEKMTQ